MNAWHLNTDQPVYTRQPEPRAWVHREVTSGFQLLAFSDTTLRHSIAVHEAAHAVLDFAFGIPVVEICVCDDLGAGADGEGGGAAGWVRNGGQWRVPDVHYFAMCAAGERAQDRWLRETGLWTPERAWVEERAADSDRQQVAHALRHSRNKELTFGRTAAGAMDYATVQAAADAALAPLWDRVLRLAAAVDDHGHLTGRQAARHAGMTYLAIPCDDDESTGAPTPVDGRRGALDAPGLPAAWQGAAA
ncbi:hypothetical protein SNS2_1544 [Streptomyces netropsis]|nr:hypothetical protein SNS2_1544 [Streptomyces netropsis]